MKKNYICCGSYGNAEYEGHGDGVTIYELNTETGECSLLDSMDILEPSVLALSPDRSWIYAVNEMSGFPDGDAGTGGGVTVLQFDEKEKKLIKITDTLALGSIPAYLSPDPTGMYMVVAIHAAFQVVSSYVRENGKYVCKRKYDPAGISLFRIIDGEMLEPVDLSYLEAEGSYWTYKDNRSLINPKYYGRCDLPDEYRLLQSRAHAHCVMFISETQFIVTDRGSDQVYLYGIDKTEHKLQRKFVYQAPLATAPRHTKLHPQLPVFYMTNEIEPTVTAFKLHLDEECFEPIQTVEIIREGSEESTGAMDLCIHPTGEYLYVTGRNNSVCVLKLNPQSGTMEQIQILDLSQKIPRSIDISDDGKLVAIACQKSDCLVLFDVDERTGALKEKNIVNGVHTPTCVRFLETINSK